MKQFEESLAKVPIDTRLEDIVMRMFEKCLADRRFKQAIGISFETRRLDVLERALYESVSREGNKVKQCSDGKLKVSENVRTFLSI